jgi:class 3 adenylate cyclase/tetratricopeptide (TPR) repeat protein
VSGGVRCPSCDTDNGPDAKFCKECGRPLSSLCPSCGAQFWDQRKFCDQCGGALGEVPTPASVPTQPAPVAERRMCSVLFADLVGFTPLSESRDPEEVRDLLSRYFDLAGTTVARYGGTVEKFIGDAVMAVWGAPTSHEDDAERAVRAALDLVVAVGTLGVPDLGLRAGVLTGQAAVTLGAAGQGMVAGDLVNTASRLQSVAQPGTVLVGEATYSASSGAVAFEEVGPLVLKGKEEPVPAWRALRVVARRRGIGRSERLEPPFVGRQEELRLLKETLHTMARDGRARLVSVTGVPGIGKSRLAWEFLKYADGLAETVYWHQGRSPAYGEGITFWALGEMVRMRAGITESEDLAAARDKLAVTVAEFVTDPEECRWVEPRLAHLLGLAEASAGQREELFSAWRTFFERIAELGPTVMVFEDLQWADPGLIDFVESILQWSRSHPILVLTLARPELTDRRPTWGAGQRNFTSVHLEPLSEESMGELLTGLVHGLSVELADRIRERAEGIPLYAVETVRMLVDRGRLVARDGGYEVVGELPDLQMPDTLHALIASRLDALSPAERALLQDAAVLGKTFPAAALSAVAGRSSVEEQLRDLVRKELLSIDSDPRSPERGQYGFVQSVIREVAYSTLARRDRRAKHLSAAHHFESVHDDELAGVVAAHYLEAHRSSPEGPERDALAARARDALSQAGERAMSLGSPEQALGFFDQALQVTAGGAERTDLLVLAGRAAEHAGSYQRALELLREALDSADSAVTAGRISDRIVYVLGFGLQRRSEAIEYGERAYAALPASGADEVRAAIASRVAETYATSGQPERGLEWAEQALVLAERLDDPRLMSRAIGCKASSLYHVGRHREAVILARGRVALAEEAGLLFDQADGLLYLSVFAADEAPREALDASIRAAEIARRAGHRGMEMLNLDNAVEQTLWLGEWARTRTMLAEMEQQGPSEDPTREEFRATCRAMLTALTDDPGRGVAMLQQLAAAMDSTEFLSHRTTYLRARALVHLISGDLEAAHRDAAETVRLDPAGINSPQALLVQARAALWLRDAARVRVALAGMEGFRGRWMAAARATIWAGLLALDGRPDSDSYQQARDAWAALDSPFDLALCLLDMVQLLGPEAAGSDLTAQLSDLGAIPLLHRFGQLTRA